MNSLVVIAAMCAGGSAYYAYGWYTARKALRSLTAIERANALIEEAKRKDAKPGLKQRLENELVRRGWKGDLALVLGGVTMLYVLISLVLRLFGLGGIAGAVVGLPISVGVVLMGLGSATTRRRRAFNHQLLQALTLLAGQIEGGNGPRRALELIIPSLQDPLRSELIGVMDATVASKNLVGALKDLLVRYPSRALSMFISALEIDEATGGRIEPALRQAADTLQRDFELSAEALAELSQTKAEFIVVVGIIGMVAVSMVTGGDATTKATYTTPVAIAVLLGLAAWFGFGIIRFLRILKKARGDS